MVPPQGSSFFQAARQGHAGSFSPWPGAPPKWGSLQEPCCLEGPGVPPPHQVSASASASFPAEPTGVSRGRVGGRRSFLRPPEARCIPPKSSEFCLPKISPHLTRLRKVESGARVGGWGAGPHEPRCPVQRPCRSARPGMSRCRVLWSP